MIDPATLDWEKMGGLMPAIVQDAASGEVRMLGYMNREALDATIASGKVTFFSRSKKRLWVKGETSGNLLHLVDVRTDCDGDAVLVRARPAGPTCHTGTDSCFGESEPTHFLDSLEARLRTRAAADPSDSYTARLMAEGVKRIAQKVGEEGVESALAAVAGDKAETTSEVADLAYHVTLLLIASGLSWSDVAAELGRRR